MACESQYYDREEELETADGEAEEFEEGHSVVMVAEGWYRGEWQTSSDRVCTVWRGFA